MLSTFSKLALAAVLTGAIALFSFSAAAETYAVVVNVENSFDGDDAAKKQQVKRLYLKEQSAWPGGIAAVPFGRADGSAEQIAFAQAVLQMSPSDIEGHWLNLKQVRGETPPRGIGSARILSRQIGKTPGAFGVVLASEVAGVENGKVLFEFSTE